MKNDSADTSRQDFQNIKKKALQGMAALFARQVLVKIIFFAGNIVLARLLAAQIFGIYAIVSFVVQFFSTFGDVGIGAALIQKKGELSQEELSTTFWLQQMLVWFVVGIAVLLAPLALKVYPTLPPAGVWLIRAMALSFLFSSLKTIPAILMERHIDFNRIARVDIAENLMFQTVAVVCASQGYGVWSFVAAAISRAFLGVALIYMLSAWRPSFCFRLKTVKGLVRFGLPYQGNQILSFVKDAVTPLFVGAYAGAAAVGYLNWARNFAFMPLMISETFGRVAFPAFSKLQDDKELLAKTVERSIRMMTLVLFPLTAIMAAMGPEITHLVFTDKWRPGILAFYFYCTSPFVIGIMLPMYSAILSLGKSDILLKMASVLLLLEWGMGVPLVLNFGFTGVSVTQPVVALIFFMVYRRILRLQNVTPAIAANIFPQLAASIFMAVCIKFMAALLVVGFSTLILLSVSAAFLYGAAVWLINKELLVEFVDYMKKLKS